MDKQTNETTNIKPPAQQPIKPPEPAKDKTVDAKQHGRRPWKFCWYDIFRGPYVEHTSKPVPQKIDNDPYDFEKLTGKKLDSTDYRP